MNTFDGILKEIPITEIENVKIGNAEDKEHATGCTVILCEQGAPAGIDVRGGGPASRETELLNPVAACQAVHAVLLSGGSAFGLDAAGGVMEYLAEKGIGFAVGDVRVPLVVESCIFDLLFVSDKVKPDKAMARKACEAAEMNCPTEGNVGAGCGATVGKVGGPEYCMNSGLGMYAVQLGDLKVGAIVSVNACGDVYDEETNRILAGMLTPDKKGFADSEKIMYQMYRQMTAAAGADNSASSSAGMDTGASASPEGGVTNTTIGCIITNARFDKSQLNKIAAFAQNGYARSIRPVHTMNDGDTIYALSTGSLQSDINIVGTLASRVMAQAVKNAVLHTESFHGLPCAADIAAKAETEK
ncbi:MAG: P1 family peptidase [Lachnospiraceae bacterium]|nr:P1 family peptidase [Lachnospiraceae bacterium]